MHTYRFKNTYFTWLQLLIVTVLVLGVFFRFVNLDRKVYWYDEGFTSLRASGYTGHELFQQTFNGQVISLEDFRKYLGPNPEKGLIDTIKSLAVEEPQHPPLYFIMTRLWMQWFGDSVAAIRSLSALISLLVFPCTYWLCLELFGSPLTGWVAIALIAISPFHVLFAQEAREYSLWTVTILLSSAALLRAMRLNTLRSWGMYAIALALGLYSFLFSGFVAIGHGIYVFAIERFHLSKRVSAYLLASLLGLLAYAPWILVVITNLSTLHEHTSWMGKAQRTSLELAYYGAYHISSIFFNSTRFDNYTKFHQLLIPFFLILVGYAIYFICRKTQKTVWLFILTLFGVTALALLLPDIISGGNRSTQSRYLIPCYLSIQLAVAYLLATQITFIPVKIKRQKLWQLVTIILLSSGVLSSALISQAEVTWNRQKNGYDYQIAHTINQASRPLLVVSNYGNPPYDPNVNYLFSFNYLLDSKVRFLLVAERNLPKIPAGFSDVFLYNPASQASKYGLEKEAQALQDRFDEQNYKIKPVPISEPVQLWRVEKQ